MLWCISDTHYFWCYTFFPTAREWGMGVNRMERRQIQDEQRKPSWSWGEPWHRVHFRFRLLIFAKWNSRYQFNLYIFAIHSTKRYVKKFCSALSETWLFIHKIKLKFSRLTIDLSKVSRSRHHGPSSWEYGWWNHSKLATPLCFLLTEFS